MHDSGEREQFNSGAVRDSAKRKPRPDLQSPYAQERIGRWMKLGAKKYTERNWEKGMLFSRCVASMERHLIAFKMGRDDEDHLAAIAVNAQFIMHYEAMIDRDLLPISLDDMPHYESAANVAVIENPINVTGAVSGRLTTNKSNMVEFGKFKAGDKVRIKLRAGADESMIIPVEEANKIGTYQKNGIKSSSGVFPHEVLVTDKKMWFYDDEVFPFTDYVEGK